MGSGVDEQHAEQHNMTGDTTSFSIVDLKSNLRSYLDTLNVEEATAVNYCPSSTLGTAYLT